MTTQPNDPSETDMPQPVVRDVMDIDDVRDQIWDHLFKTKAIHPLDEIVALVGRDSAIVRSAIDHEWFRVADDRVSIAYVAR